MDTPLGLSYTPIFPLLQSLQKQADQIKQQREKAVAEQRKTAETRAFQATTDAFKFHPDRPYVHSLEPYFQNQANQQFELVRGVNNGTVDPRALYEHMNTMQQDADAAKRYDTETQAFMNKWKESGNYDTQKVLEMYANHTIDLTATHVNGTATRLPPQAVDPNNFVNDVLTSSSALNKAALSEKFITALKKTEEQQNAEKDPAGNVVAKITGLPDTFFDPIPGSGGQHLLNLGAINSTQSKVLLGRFREMGPDFERYLQLRAGEDDPAFKTMTPGSEEWGTQMQVSLQKLMRETGFIGRKQTEQYVQPKTESDKQGTAFDPSKIGGNAKNEAAAIEGAEFVHRVLSQDPRALSFFAGPNVESIKYKKGMIEIIPKQGKIDQFAQTIAQINGAKMDDKTGAILIPNSRNGIAGIVHMRNNVATSTGGDWNDIWVEKAYNKKYTEGTRKAPAAPKKNETEDQMRDLRKQLSSDMGVQVKSHEEAIKNLSSGDHYILNGVEYEIE